MKFIEVDKLPRAYHNLMQKWTEFMSMNVKTVEIELDEDEYSNVYVAQRTMTQSINRRGFPINVNVRSGKIYLTRRDM